MENELKGILRLKQSQLEHRDGLLCYQGQAFSGNSYLLDGDRVVDIARVEQGKVVERYKPELVPGPALSMDAFEDDEEPFIYQEQRFNGTIYEFYDSLQTIIEVKNGIMSGQRDFYENGLLESIGSFDQEDKLGQTISFDEDGSLTGIDVHFSPQDRLEAVFTHGLCQKFQLVGCFYDNYQGHVSRLIKSELYSMEKASNVKFSESATLRDNGISDDLLLTWINNGESFNATKRLTLSRTNVSQDTLVRLAETCSLDELSVESRDSDLRAAAMAFKQASPDTQVTYNREEL